MKVPSFNPRALTTVPSPVMGFSMTKLLQLAQSVGADMVAAQWSGAQVPVVPSVVHWKQNHYGAILGLVKRKLPGTRRSPPGQRASLADRRGDCGRSQRLFYCAERPVARRMAVSGDRPDRLRPRPRGGYIQAISDPSDACGKGSGGADSGVGQLGTTGSGGCSGCAPAASGASGGGLTGGGGASCATCGSERFQRRPPGRCLCGHARWEYSEPYINVWLYDKLGDQPGLGDRVAFRLAYKQRESRPILPCIFNFGPNWDCSWLSYIKDVSQSNSATMIVPGGGERTYTPDNTTLEYFSHTALQRTANQGALTGFIVSYTSGAKDYYQLVPTNRIDACATAFLTAKVNPSATPTASSTSSSPARTPTCWRCVLRQYGWPHQHLELRRQRPPGPHHRRNRSLRQQRHAPI